MACTEKGYWVERHQDSPWGKGKFRSTPAVNDPARPRRHGKRRPVRNEHRRAKKYIHVSLKEYIRSQPCGIIPSHSE